jgi:hypothetical protein
LDSRFPLSACFCNGAIFSFIYLASSEAGPSFRYVFRSFSIFDGTLVADTEVESPWPI